MLSASFKSWVKKGMEYFKYMSAEFLSYINYINAMAIGFTINIFTGHGFPGKPAPYLVPIVVQSLSKSAVRYKNRHMTRLVQLPSEREDPVFIMNETGNILLSTGLTYQRFRKNKINNISQIIGENNFNNLMKYIHKNSKDKRQLELYSGLFRKWYEIKIKSIHSSLIKQDKEFLIWFTDITALKKQEKRMSNMLQFSNDIISSLPMTLDKYTMDEIYKILAEYILSNGFRSIFIARMIERERYKGFLYKHQNDVVEKINSITVTKESLPCFGLNGNSHIIAGSKKKNITQNNFESKYSFDKNFNSCIDFPVKNFINYQSDNVYILAMNKKNGLTKSDNKVMELIAENLKIVTDMKKYVSSYFTNYVKALNEDQF